MADAVAEVPKASFMDDPPGLDYDHGGVTQ